MGRNKENVLSVPRFQKSEIIDNFNSIGKDTTEVFQKPK